MEEEPKYGWIQDVNKDIEKARTQTKVNGSRKAVLPMEGLALPPYEHVKTCKCDELSWIERGT